MNHQRKANVALSVVIPMHNSETVIHNTVGQWVERLDGQSAELILVENGSTDNTWIIAQDIARAQHNISRVVLQSEKGMGNALRAGIARSSGVRVLLSADDLPFGFSDLDSAENLGRHPDVVIGSKAHQDSVVERGILRSAFTNGYKMARRVILGSKVGDTQGTFFVDGEWLRSINHLLDEPGFLFTTQLVVYAESHGKELVEVPVALSDDHAPKTSTVGWRDVVSMGSGLVRLRRFKSHNLDA